MTEVLSERLTRERGVETIDWVPLDLTDPEALALKLTGFWSLQDPKDICLRFFKPISLLEIYDKYLRAFKNAKVALGLSNGERLVGFSIGVEDSKCPEWLEIATEVDQDYRRHGFASRAHNMIYAFARELGYAGVKASILATNTASIRSIAKITGTYATEVRQCGGVICYYIGDISRVPIVFDLLD